MRDSEAIVSQQQAELRAAAEEYAKKMGEAEARQQGVEALRSAIKEGVEDKPDIDPIGAGLGYGAPLPPLAHFLTARLVSFGRDLFSSCHKRARQFCAR